MAVLASSFGLEAPAIAAILRVAAKNGTTGRPAAGDEVVLMPLTGHATEAGRGKTNSSGGVEFTVAEMHAPYLVRVLHEGVVYQSLAPPGVNSVEVQVYETAKTLDGVAATWSMQRLQTAGDRLQVIDEITIRNASNPPRTLANDRPFEIHLPPEAEVVAGKVQIGDEPPIIRNPSASGEKDRYYFSIPLLPGDTRFAVAYRLPYRGEAVIQPMTVAPMAGLVVVLPDTMKFEAKSRGLFQPLPDRAGVHIYGTAAGKQGQPMAFRVSGAGRLPESERGQHRAQQGGPARAGRSQGATGAPPARDAVRWFMLGGFAIVAAAAAGAFVAYKRKAAATLSSFKS